MKKLFKPLICAGLCVAMAGSVAVNAACKKTKLDPEVRPMQLSIGALDGNFNPFFSTSQNDTEMANMTQISMFTTDENAELVWGEDYPTVAQDVEVKYYDAKSGGNQVQNGTMDGRTEYRILIKNGIKFSDGEPLTIKDVLFNIYVLLDPAYTGSMTLYSTDIQGLNAYRAQDPSVTDDEELSNSQYYGEAQSRIQSLIDWSSNEKPSLDTQGEKDLQTVKELFAKEAESDWTSMETTWSTTYEDEYAFTAAWQAYLFAEGLVKYQEELHIDGSTTYIKVPTQKLDDEGNPIERYLTTLEPYNSAAQGYDSAQPNFIEAQRYIDEVAEATTEAKVTTYMQNNDCDREYALLQLQKEYCVEQVIAAYTAKSGIQDILTGWATGNEAQTQFAQEARAAYYERIPEAERVKSVSGITWEKQVTNFNGVALDGDHDVLKIVINGVDPKAMWNFAIPVMPLHYYSGTWNGKDYVAAFDGINNFGVEVGNPNFFNSVVKATSKNGLPIGAGAYAASKSSGGLDTSRTDFYKNNIVYFERNPYFETTGKNVQNAKIKYLRYKVYSDDLVLSALETGEIDYGEPNAKEETPDEIRGYGHLGQESYLTNGYGYVGINPKYVKNYSLRLAIMKVMDTSMIVTDYYGPVLARTIYRPMSITSWAYPEGASSQGQDWAFTTNDEEIKQLMQDAGYTPGNGRGTAQGLNGERLKFKFTIAGESLDHPARMMFRQAAERLNNLGWDIEVSADIQALKNLASGNLAVWAAAWSSGLDPDMYQVYHKDSQATSVLNWNYPNIVNTSDPTFNYERKIINDLSDLIEEGRETDDREARKATYSQCLDKIMELAVELPTYQRSDIGVYNKNVLDRNTMLGGHKPSFAAGLLSRIWEVDYVK